MSGAYPADLTVEIAFDGVTYSDVSDLVKAATIKRAQSTSDPVFRRYQTGTATVTLDNSDRRFDPYNLSGPYVAGGVSLVEPGRPIRITSTYGAYTYSRFTGRVRSWPIEWTQSRTSTVTIPCTDAAADLESVKLAALVDEDGDPAPVGTGELSGDRINRILDAAGFTGPRIVSGGSRELQGTAYGRSAWQELLLTVDSEGGDMFIDGAGAVVFRSRGDVFTAARSVTSQATFSDA